MTDQTGWFGVGGFEREVEADEFLIALDELEGFGAGVVDLLGDAVELVIEDIAQALGEDERENELLVFGCVLGAADAAGGIPDPGFERFAIDVHTVDGLQTSRPGTIPGQRHDFRTIRLNNDYCRDIMNWSSRLHALR